MRSLWADVIERQIESIITEILGTPNSSCLHQSDLEATVSACCCRKLVPLSPPAPAKCSERNEREALRSSPGSLGAQARSRHWTKGRRRRPRAEDSSRRYHGSSCSRVKTAECFQAVQCVAGCPLYPATVKWGRGHGLSRPRCRATIRTTGLCP